MPVTTGVLVLSALAFSLAGQLLWKSAAHDLAALGRVDFLLAAVRDARIVSGLAAWAMWTICWLQVLRVMPLSKAYEHGFDILIRHRAHPDAVEGPAAFMEKREPKWANAD